MKSYISPNYTYEKLENPSFDDLIDVFEDQIMYFMLIPAEQLIDSEYGFMAAMNVLFTYFERIHIYHTGQDSKDKSKEFFINGFLSVFGTPGKDKSQLRNIADVIYTEGRCGFFHEGISGKRILYSIAREEALTITLPKVNGEPDCLGKVLSIVVNPKRFLQCIKIHFDKYIRDLRTKENTSLRNCFKCAVDKKWGLGDSPIIGLTEKEFLRK
jgi:hypothetical protein